MTLSISRFLYQELRDENDELRLQCEALTQQVNNSVKRRPSHRKRQDSQKVHRHGSVLSDYTKPVVIKRNKEGVTSSDESDTADHPDGTRVPSVRVSGDGGSNEDAGKLRNSCTRKVLISYVLCSIFRCELLFQVMCDFNHYKVCPPIRFYRAPCFVCLFPC